MPYIVQPKRDTLDPTIDELHKILVGMEMDDESNNMEGNLNYIFTRILRMCYTDSYSQINDAMGVLSCVMLEHYRTKAAPYEDQKIYDNGDVVTDSFGEILSEIVVRKPDDAGC